jgi:hypothetical protein
LVTENFRSRVVRRNELATYTSCRLGTIKQRILIPIPGTIVDHFAVTKLDEGDNVVNALIKLLGASIEDVFDVVVTYDTEIVVQDLVTCSILATSVVGAASASRASGMVQATGLQSVVLEWVSNPTSDMVADSTLAVITQAMSAPSLLKLSLGWNSQFLCGSIPSKRAGASEEVYAGQAVDEGGRARHFVGSRRRAGDVSRSRSRDRPIAATEV